MLDDDESKAAITRRSILALPIAGWAVGVAAAEPGVSATEIVIGQNITLQGGKNDYGVAVMEGIKACLDQVNAAGGVYGRRIVLRTLDDQNSSTQAEANARKLVAEQAAFVLFGSIEEGRRLQ